MVKECLEIFLHLDGVVVDLRHAEDPELAILPGPVLLQQEGQQHEEAAVMNNPPNIDVSLDLDHQRDVKGRFVEVVVAVEAVEAVEGLRGFK